MHKGDTGRQGGEVTGSRFEETMPACASSLIEALMSTSKSPNKCRVDLYALGSFGQQQEERGIREVSSSTAHSSAQAPSSSEDGEARGGSRHISHAENEMNADISAKPCFRSKGGKSTLSGAKLRICHEQTHPHKDHY